MKITRKLKKLKIKNIKCPICGEHPILSYFNTNILGEAYFPYVNNISFKMECPCGCTIEWAGNELIKKWLKNDN